MDIQYACWKIKSLCEDCKSYMNDKDRDEAVAKIRDIVTDMSAEVRQSRGDGAFFAGELTGNAGERNVRYTYEDTQKKI